VGNRQDRSSDQGSGSRLDPATGVQALVEVQRRGLLAANELVDRLVRSVDGDDVDGAEPPDESAGSSGSRRDSSMAPSAGGPADDLVRVWVEVVRLGLETFGNFLMPTGPGRPGSSSHVATLDVATAASTGVVRVVMPGPPPSGGSTDRASAEVWLHNGSAAAYSDVALHCGDLRSSDGAVLPAASVRFDPSVMDLPARSSRGVVVSVGADVPSGTYRGVVLATGVPDAWLPIEVVNTAERHEA
jgi:hypothetical protein